MAQRRNVSSLRQPQDFPPTVIPDGEYLRQEADMGVATGVGNTGPSSDNNGAERIRPHYQKSTDFAVGWRKNVSIPSYRRDLESAEKRLMNLSAPVTSFRALDERGLPVTFELNNTGDTAAPFNLGPKAGSLVFVNDAIEGNTDQEFLRRRDQAFRLATWTPSRPPTTQSYSKSLRHYAHEGVPPNGLTDECLENLVGDRKPSRKKKRPKEHSHEDSYIVTYEKRALPYDASLGSFPTAPSPSKGVRFSRAFESPNEGRNLSTVQISSPQMGVKETKRYGDDTFPSLGREMRNSLLLQSQESERTPPASVPPSTPSLPTSSITLPSTTPSHPHQHSFLKPNRHWLQYKPRRLGASRRENYRAARLRVFLRAILRNWASYVADKKIALGTLIQQTVVCGLRHVAGIVLSPFSRAKLWRRDLNRQ